ncbi:MAG: adenosylmethionine--8-amino-7-oxononanoate aminotransferase BioA, partial [Zetaproteobacteria bacterium CG02_land_8_20_14_3_00_50_9]
VIEMKQSVDVGRVQQQLIEQGVWLRPFGKLIYTMPPYVIEASQLEQLTSAMCAVVLRP